MRYMFILSVKGQGQLQVELFSKEDLLEWESKISKKVIKTNVTEKYEFIDLIGSGASGKVFVAQVKEAYNK